MALFLYLATNNVNSLTSLWNAGHGYINPKLISWYVFFLPQKQKKKVSQCDCLQSVKGSRRINCFLLKSCHCGILHSVWKALYCLIVPQSVQEQEEKQRQRDEKERQKQEAKAAKERKKEEARKLKEEKEREKKEKKEKDEKERREKKEREEKEKAEKLRAKEEQRQMKIEWVTQYSTTIVVVLVFSMSIKLWCQSI